MEWKAVTLIFIHCQTSFSKYLLYTGSALNALKRSLWRYPWFLRRQQFCDASPQDQAVALRPQLWPSRELATYWPQKVNRKGLWYQVP